MDSTSSPSNSTAGLPGSPLHAIRAHSVTEAVNAALHGQPSSVLPDNDELAHVIRRVPLQPLGHIDPDRINTLAADIYQAQQQQQQSQPQHQEQQQQEQQHQEQQHQQQGQSGGSNRQQQTDDDYMMPELLEVSDSSTEDSDEERGDATDDDGAGDDGSVPSLHDLSDSSDEEDDDYESEEEEAEAAAVAAAPRNEPMPRDSMWAAMPAVFTPLAPRNNAARPGFLQMMNQLIFESAADATDTTRAEELMRGLEPVSAELARRFVRAGGEAMCAVCREDLVSGGEDAVTPLTSVPDLSSPADAVRSPVQYLDASAHRGPPMPFEQRTPPATSADVLALPCHHAFHAACLHPWLARRTTCPTCRLDLDPESLTLRMPIATASTPVSPELLDILGSPIPLNDGSGRSVFLPPSPEQLQRVGTHNAALFEQAQRLQAGQMRAQAAGQPATPASTQNSTLIEQAQPRLQAEQMRARTAGQPATPASPPSDLQMRFQTPPRPALVQHDPALLEQIYRVQMERLALLHANNSVPSASPAGPTPGLQMGTALAQTARNLSNVQQDLARVAAMLPRLEESMRTLSALTEEHIAQHHAASEEASVPPEAAATPSEPTDAPPAPSDPAPVPAPAMSDPAPAPGPVDPTSAPAPPQPAAIEGSLLDNDHLRFMLGATVPPAPSPASSVLQRTDGDGTPLAPENLHVPPQLTMPGVPPPMRVDLSNTRSMAVERDFQARLAVLRAYGPGALMDVDLPSLIDEDSALAEALVVEDEWDNARTAELTDGMGTVAAHAAPPWPPFAAGAAEDAQAHTAADADGDAQAFQARAAGDGDTSVSHVQTPAHGRRGWRIRRASSGLAAAHLVGSWRSPASSSAAADRNIDDSAASASVPTPAADAPSAASTSTPTPPPAQVDTPVEANAASGSQSTLPTSDQVQVRRSVAALDAERRSIEAQLEAARRTQQELLDRLRQEQTLNAARRIGRVVRPAAQDTGPQSAAARAFHMLRAAGPGTGTGAGPGPGAPPAAPEPRKKWVCPPPKGGMSLLAWVAQREGEAGEGEKEDVVRVLAVPRPRESSEGA